MNIEGMICRLRALEPEDLDRMYGWENDSEVWRVSGTVAPFSRHTLSRLIDEQRFDIYATRQLRLVIESKGAESQKEAAESNGVVDNLIASNQSAVGEAVGAIDLFEFDPQNLRAGVGIIVAPPYRRRGLAADALRTLERYAVEVLRLHQLWCSVGADNKASLALFAKAGYTECGRRREWILTPDGAIDEVLMQKIL